MNRVIGFSTAVILLGISCGDTPPREETVESGSQGLETVEVIEEENEVQIDSVQAEQDTVFVISESQDPSGSWSSTMGEMVFSIDDSGHVIGNYPLGTLEGDLMGFTLEFTYDEGYLEGVGSFTFDEDFGSFTGIQDIAGTELLWEGERI